MALVERYRLARAALRALIDEAPGLRVAADAECYPGLLAACAGAGPPDVLVVSVGEAVEVESLFPSGYREARPRLLVLAGEEAQEGARRAAAAGASGLVRKREPGDTLIKAIEKVHAGEMWFDGATMALLIADMAGIGAPEEPRAGDPAVAALTERDLALVAGVAEGYKNRELAERCGVTEASVRHALTRIYGALGVKNRLDLARFALDAGICPEGAARRPAAADRPTGK